MKLLIFINISKVLQIVAVNKYKQGRIMNVSRIEAISPKQIDWRKLTAKEIIKYDNQGINVPPEYLQWAKEFRADLTANDKDETTYEMASKNVNPSPAETAQSPVDTESGDENSAQETDEPIDEKTTAQQKRQDLQDSGVSLRKQAKIFTKDSKEASKSVLQSAAIISNTEDMSNNEIQALDNYMSQLLSKAESIQNELKSEVAKINDGKNDVLSFGKINKLQKRLEQYGNEGQANLAGAEADFNQYESIINGHTDAIFNAQDFGTETIGVGKELLKSKSHGFFLFDYIIDKRAVRSGERAVNFSEITAQIQTEALTENSENKAAVAGLKNDVQDKTGVAAISQSKQGDNDGSKGGEENPSDPSNKATEVDKAASANLDQVLQAKIKKGENIIS